MITLTMCLAGGVIALVLLLVVGLPLALLLGFAPWFLGLMGVVLLVKGLLERPMTFESFKPAIIAIAASAVLGWIF